MVVKSLKCLYRSPVLSYVTGWYLLFDVVTLTDILVTWPWHIYTDTCHAIFDIWYLTPVLAMLYLTHDTRHRYLPCYIYRLLPNTWYNNTWPDIVAHIIYCIFMTITFTGIWHDYYTVTRYLVLLYSWTPILLNSCILEPLKKGDSWYYTPVSSHSWIIMVILYTLLDITFGQYI